MGDLVTPEFGNYRRGRVANLLPATLYRFSEHRSLVSRYQDSCRQADVLNASFVDLWLRAYAASVYAAMCIAGLHVPNNGRGEQTCRTETVPAEFAGASARKLQPEEPA